MSAAVAVRAPRLTDNRLDDLTLVVLSLASEIEYLAEAIPTYPKGSDLHTRLTLRHDSLVRGRDWIAGKIDAERAHRAEAVPS